MSGQQGHEHTSVGAAPARDRVPAGLRLVTGDCLRREADRVVPAGDVVERLVVQGATADPVDGRVHEAEVVGRVLVGERYEPCP